METRPPRATSSYLNAAPRDKEEVRERKILKDIERRVAVAEQAADRVPDPDDAEA